MVPRGMKRAMRKFQPILSADLVEGETNYTVHVDLPGVNEADLDIKVLNGFLTIKAERRQVTEKDTTFSHKQERTFGSVERTNRIPDDAREETADAKYNNGVLEVVFLKKEGALASHKLAIKPAFNA